MDEHPSQVSNTPLVTAIGKPREKFSPANDPKYQKLACFCAVVVNPARIITKNITYRLTVIVVLGLKFLSNKGYQN
jgi:hypothetical protein